MALLGGRIEPHTPVRGGICSHCPEQALA
jgi:hypothetical protein